jgi:hypothetical protein
MNRNKHPGMFFLLVQTNIPFRHSDGKMVALSGNAATRAAPQKCLQCHDSGRHFGVWTTSPRRVNLDFHWAPFDYYFNVSVRAYPNDDHKNRRNFSYLPWFLSSLPDVQLTQKHRQINTVTYVLNRTQRREEIRWFYTSFTPVFHRWHWVFFVI